MSLGTVRRVALATATIVGAALTASPVRAQPPARLRQGAAQRPAMEQLARVVQTRLGLSADQASRLRETTRRFAGQRQQLMQQERATRRALRLSTAAGDSADQRVIAAQLDTLLRLQQRRVQLLADEQHDLGAFLTPYQRAQFLAMQERAFRAAQQLRQQRAAKRGAPMP